MKHTTHFVSTRLVSLVLSLFLVFGTAASSLSAVTDLSIAEQTAPAAPALDGAAGSVASAADAASYGVAEGSLLAQPDDDDVLDIDLDDDTPAAALSAPLTLSRDKNTDLAATGAAVTGSLDTSKTYYLGSDSDTYRLVYESGWKVKRTSDSLYYNVTYSNYITSGSWGSSGTTTYTVSTANASGVTLNCSVTEAWNTTTYYLTYSNGSFSVKSAYNNYPRIAVYEAAVTYMVTFEKNDGSGTTTTQNNIPANTATALTANTFTREGYTFTGWNTAADGSGTSYDDKASVTLSASITLYAQWQQDAPPASANTLYFTQPYGWNAPRAYYWKDGVEGIWPGVNMTFIGNNSMGEAIYSVSISPDEYDHVIFNATDNNDSSKTYETVTIDIDDALANGAGVYCINLNPGYEADSEGHYYVNFYTYGDKSSTGDPNTITYKKQIEKLNPTNDADYNYRLHLNVDGTALKDTVTETSEKKRKVALIIDGTETMTADGMNGQDARRKKFGLAYDFLFSGTTGSAKELLDGNTEVSIIFIGGEAGNGSSYTSLYQLAAEDLTSYSAAQNSTIKNKWDSFHLSQQISYNTAWKAIEKEYSSEIANNEELSLVFIVGNAPQTLVNITSGINQGAVTGAAEQNQTDGVQWMKDHPNITLYGLGMISDKASDIERGSTEISAIAEASGGSYQTAATQSAFDEVFSKITKTILSGDKTSNITVTDKLSEYVDFAEPKKLTATLYTGYNSTTGGWSNSTIFTESDAELTSSEDTVTFSRPAEIEGPFKLEIVFDIKTADGVLQNPDTYGESGYPNEGDDGTDYSTASYNRNFSANKPGYYANSSATISYNLNGTTVNGTFIKPVVQAPAETPVQGKYIFKYIDRYNTERTVEVPVTLNSSEKNGYSGNNNQKNVPTFLWTADAKNLFPNNPLVTAALRVDGNDDNELSENPDSQKDVSVYKHTIEWDNLNTATYTEGSNVSYSSADHTVTVTANTPVMTFTFNYKIMKDGEMVKNAATQIPYGRAVTFHPQYSDTSKYAYINDTIPSEGFSYWSADEEGNIPITTNLTFGMLIRGDFTHEEDGETIVTVYAQYNKTPKNDWNPLIEEAKLTHTVEDTGGRQIDWLYLDYMTNYLSKDGSVVKDMIDAGNSNIRYGIVAVKHDGTKTPDQPKMIKIAQAMIKNDKQSAYLDSKKQAIAYRFEYGSANTEVKPISNFNRVLYTLRTDTEKAENHTFSAIAYITVDGTNYFYSEVNSDIVVHDLIEN